MRRAASIIVRMGSSKEWKQICCDKFRSKDRKDCRKSPVTATRLIYFIIDVCTSTILTRINTDSFFIHDHFIRPSCYCYRTNALVSHDSSHWVLIRIYHSTKRLPRRSPQRLNTAHQRPAVSLRPETNILNPPVHQKPSPQPSLPTSNSPSYPPPTSPAPLSARAQSPQETAHTTPSAPDSTPSDCAAHPQTDELSDPCLEA